MRLLVNLRVVFEEVFSLKVMKVKEIALVYATNRETVGTCILLGIQFATGSCLHYAIYFRHFMTCGQVFTYKG